MTGDLRKRRPLLIPFPSMPFMDETAELPNGKTKWVVKRKPRVYPGGSVPGSTRRKKESEK